MILRPSEANRWMKCAASAHFVPDGPEPDNDAAMEGTAAAWLADMCHPDPNTVQMFLGQQAPNGVIVDAEMVVHITEYLRVLEDKTWGVTENFLRHPTLPLEGTSDFMGWTRDRKTLYITDLKYGYRVVEPDSWQLAAYLALVLRTIPANEYPEMVQLAIYQPRAIHPRGPYRKRVLSLDEAWELVIRVENRVIEVMQDKTAHPGSHCTNCLRAFKCAALTHTVYHMFGVVENRAEVTPTPYQLSGELDMLDMFSNMLEARKAAVEAEAMSLMNSGKYIPGWAVESRWGKRSFNVDPEVVRMVTGVDPYEKKVVTPAELERRGADKAVVKSISHRPRIGEKLERAKSETMVADLFAAAKAGAST